MQKFVPAGLVPTGFQKITLSNSTAVAVNSTVRAAGTNALLVTVETQSARLRCDATAPTLTTGVCLTVAAGPYFFDGYNGSANWKFQRSTGTCTVSIQGFRRGPSGA